MSTKKVSTQVVKAAFDAAAPSPGARGLLDRVGPKHPLPAYETTKPLEELTRQVLLRYIEADPRQPRTKMDQQELEDLAASIRETGIRQYISLKKIPDSDHYRVIAGHRRVAAARLAGLEAIPAVIRSDDYTDAQVRIEQLVENIQRADLAPLDAAHALQSFMESENLSQRKAADRLGKPLIYITELLTILKIDPKLLAKAEHLPKRALIEIGRASTPAEQKTLLDAALSSDAPHTTVKRARTQEASRREPRYPYRYPVAQPHATVTVTFDEEPSDVAEDVIAALTAVVQKLAGAKVEKISKGRGRG